MWTMWKPVVFFEDVSGGGGLLHSTFFSGSTFCFIPSMCFSCIICRLKRKHNLPYSVDLECEYGKHMAPSNATVLLLLFVWSHPQRGVHRWDLSFEVTDFCSCRQREFTWGKKLERDIVRSGSQLRSWYRRMPPSSCLLTRHRNLHLRRWADSLI